MSYKVSEGDYAKLGIKKKKDGIVFTFEGEREDACSILLHNEVTKEDILIDVPEEYCIGALRSIYIEGIDLEHTGYLFVRDKEAYMDPYAYAVMGRDIYGDKKRKETDYKVYGRFVFPKSPDKPTHGIEIPKHEMFIYKLHARGFTMDGGIKGDKKGTFLGIIQKIPYLKVLGVTSLELMPVYEYEEFDLQKLPYNPYIKGKHSNLICKKQLNYWGYKEGQYFAVKASYARNPKNADKEFLKLVNRLHEEGMECIMEMYFPETVNQNLIVEALEFWAKYYHVDGFKLLGRTIPIMAILQNSYLARCKILYENYPQEAFDTDRKYKRLFVDKEEYQYPARQMLNHINGNMLSFADQQKKQGQGHGYINYMASNNGFSYIDLFLYNDRHNEANGEDNYDGPCNNFSHNYGVEGPSKKAMVKKLRKRQWKNGLTMLFLAQGVPMLMAGDEFGNSKQGNNNSYCQDNEIGWVNWKNLRSHGEEIDFVKELVKLRLDYPILAKEEPFTFTDLKGVGIPDLSYHGRNPWITGIGPDMMALGMLYSGAYGKPEKKSNLYVAYNFYATDCSLAIPLAAKLKWKVIFTTGEGEISTDRTLKMDGHSICILASEE